MKADLKVFKTGDEHCVGGKSDRRKYKKALKKTVIEFVVPN